jgi:hypothetical protein
MKFTKFGKALLMSALSAGVILSVSSCVQSYTVGYLYVTGTTTTGTGEPVGSGYITGFKIDHNTGFLTPINGLSNPYLSSGGANPVRAVLLSSSRFLYVLNRGVNKEGNSDCTTADPCLNANISQFSVGANGILTPQETFTTQGFNPFRMFADASGSFLYVLDHDSPDNYSGATGNANGCVQALSGIQTCGDITAFQIDKTTGRLSSVVNDQVKITTTAGGTQNLTYFPVPANPVDFVQGGSGVLTMSGTPSTASASCSPPAASCYPYTGGTTVFPYTYNSTNGQLMASNNTSQTLNISQGTAIISGGGYIFVLDNEPLTVTLNGVSTTYPSQILPWTSGANGALNIENSGPIPDDANQSNPLYLMVESKGKWFYVINQGIPSTPTLPLSGIAGYVMNNPFQPTEIGGTPIGFGTGGGPQCLVEDPSNQFFYTANSYDSSVTGQEINQQAGNLTPLSQSSKAPSQYTLTGPPTWCLVDGRTD